jgi:exosortase family protein XrtF
MNLLHEFKPALRFLAIFLGIYLAGNILYGLYIESHAPKADPVTWVVTSQSSACINVLGGETVYQHHPLKASISLMEGDDTIIGVFEGCNGINVMIIFVAFILAFGGPKRSMLWFIPAGLLVIHVVNLLRIGLLYLTAQHYEQYFYYVHKYFFTAILYFVIFILWAIWVLKFNSNAKQNTSRKSAI